MLILIAPLGLMNAIDLIRAARVRPHIDFLTATAFREVASGIAGVGFAILGVSVVVRGLTGTLLLPPGLSVPILVVSVLLTQLPVLVRRRNIASYRRRVRGS